MRYYKLMGRLAVPCADLTEWGVWFQSADRHVARTEIGPMIVSTVFLGLDHRIGPGPPLLFETMIFDDGDDGYQARCETWVEAERHHAEAVELAQARLAGANRLIAGT